MPDKGNGEKEHKVGVLVSGSLTSERLWPAGMEPKEKSSCLCYKKAFSLAILTIVGPSCQLLLGAVLGADDPRPLFHPLSLF